MDSTTQVVDSPMVVAAAVARVVATTSSRVAAAAKAPGRPATDSLTA